MVFLQIGNSYTFCQTFPLKMFFDAEFFYYNGRRKSPMMRFVHSSPFLLIPFIPSWPEPLPGSWSICSERSLLWPNSSINGLCFCLNCYMHFHDRNS